jgi:hypothetical protein
MSTVHLPVRRHRLAQRRRHHIAQRPGRQRRRINWSAITSFITATTAVGALIFTAESLDATRAQVSVAEQSQYTERYSRAIEQLGNQGPDRLQIRLGGIYALERLARDSLATNPPSMKSSSHSSATTFRRNTRELDV